MVGIDMNRAPLTRNQRLVLRAVENGKKSIGEIARQTGLKRNSVRKALHGLEDKRMVRRSAKDRFEPQLSQPLLAVFWWK